MISKTFKRIGKHHVNNCEDSVGEYEVGSQRKMIVCCDGCSMGNNSYYASELIQKLVKKIAKEEYYREYGDNRKFEIQDLLKVICRKLFEDLKNIYRITGSHKYDYLTTIVIGIVDELENEYACLIAGDGVVQIDEELIIYDQDNQPDYIGYHLEKNFEEWYNNQTTIRIGKVEAVLSLSTDGILTFSNPYDEQISDTALTKIMNKILSYSANSNVNQIQNVIDELINNHNLAAIDDIGICKLELNGNNL